VVSEIDIFERKETQSWKERGFVPFVVIIENEEKAIKGVVLCDAQRLQICEEKEELDNL